MVKKSIKKILSKFGYTVIDTNHYNTLLKEELSYDLDGEFTEIYEKTKQFTMTSMERMYSMYKATEYVTNNNIHGDIVECGVWKGTTSYAGMLYSNWNNKKGSKRFWLVDSWEGLDVGHLIDGEDEQYARGKDEKYKGIFPSVNNVFGSIEGVHLVKGFVPDVLNNITSTEIAYLHIDMNSAYPEVEALKYFWGRLVPGAIVVLDDYGFSSHEMQKKVIDDFCAENGSEVLTLPTGQGIITK